MATTVADFSVMARNTTSLWTFAQHFDKTRPKLAPGAMQKARQSPGPPDIPFRLKLS